jgi:hypothetical protein
MPSSSEEGKKCHPCVRKTLLPISQEGQRGLADAGAANPFVYPDFTQELVGVGSRQPCRADGGYNLVDAAPEAPVRRHRRSRSSLDVTAPTRKTECRQ